MFYKTQPKRHRVLLAISLALTPLGVYSQSMLDEVVVSASRSEQKAFDAHGSIDVVNRQTIERSGPQINLSEALGMTPWNFCGQPQQPCPGSSGFYSGLWLSCTLWCSGR